MTREGKLEFCHYCKGVDGSQIDYDDLNWDTEMLWFEGILDKFVLHLSFLLLRFAQFAAQVNGMSKAMGEFSAKVEGTQGWIIKLHSKLATFDLLSNAALKTADVFGRFSESGTEHDKRMHELSAIAGVTGPMLREIEDYARSSAKAFDFT